MDNFENNRRTNANNCLELDSISSFTKKLEKHLFSDVVVSCIQVNDDTTHLVIEVHCNFNLADTILHIKNGIWGDTINSNTTSFFYEELAKLNKKNPQQIDIEEITIFLKDTSIVINRIYNQSIPDQLENIIQELEKNYIYFTKGKTEIPFEIYVPVFEENIIEADTTLIRIETDTNQKTDYFSFWGLYYNSQEDAVIYDLAEKSIVYGDLYMLNH